jgi:hypothetical protein
MAFDIMRLRRLAECDPIQTPEEAVKDLRELAVTVMHVGSLEDCAELIDLMGVEFLRQALRDSPPIAFMEKAWVYWHRRLNGWYATVPPWPRGSENRGTTIQ